MENYGKIKLKLKNKSPTLDFDYTLILGFYSIILGYSSN